MKRIILLPDNVKHMIAAGEVVEGPFSVVKELVENSIDAGAASVDVQVTDSGLRRIMVRDSGSGIPAEDLPLAIQEHATSKIRGSSDLNSVTTYGFRGEALSSIASISDIVILSRTADNRSGARLESSSGEVKLSGYEGEAGTTVIVDNLFYNMPARKKFLKSKKTELRSIREVVLKMALPSYRISFTLDVDGKREITLPAAENLDERVCQIFGKTILNSLYYEELHDLKVGLKGFLSKPDFMKGSRSMQYLYVNNRPVENRLLQFHLSRAYEAVIPRGKYPAALIFIEIDPELIDVNIHPAKREVKLFDQRYIDEMIFGLASKSLNRVHRIPESLLSAGNISLNDNRVSGGGPAIPLRREIFEYRNESQYSGSLFEDGEVPVEIKEDIILPGYRILGTLFGTYIMVEEGDELHLIDFHAAHERLLYDKLKNNAGAGEFGELMFPVTLELPVDEYRLVLDNISVFQNTGFEIEEFSDNTVVIRSAPLAAGNDKIDELVKNMIDNIKEGVKSNDINERFYSLIACHSAKRAGDRLNGSDMESLVRTVMDGGIELRCPHGRPFFFSMSRNDLERMFKR